MIEKLEKYMTGLVIIGALAVGGTAYLISEEGILKKKTKEETQIVRQHNKYNKEFTQRADDVYEQAKNLIQLHQNKEYINIGLLTEIKNVFADGNEDLVMTKKAEQDLDFLVNETTIVGKLLRDYRGPENVPNPTVGERKTFDELVYQNRRWSGVIRELIDTDNDRKYSEDELNKAVYKVLHQ